MTASSHSLSRRENTR